MGISGFAAMFGSARVRNQNQALVPINEYHCRLITAGKLKACGREVSLQAANPARIPARIKEDFNYPG
jgi:hypothetical protein